MKSLIWQPGKAESTNAAELGHADEPMFQGTSHRLSERPASTAASRLTTGEMI
jgi:hypothetical protein